ncbi:MAG TPA: alpha/beta hydrolase [Acidimicrobiales bacterium]|nr:alpha/beta hydrolase [Acidimicrobiales bacterium]
MTGVSATDVPASCTTISVGGHEVELTRAGTEGRTPPVLYLHGLCDIHSAADGRALTPFLDALARRSAVLSPALPGYGRSGGVQSMHDMEDYVFHLVDLLECLDLEEVDVVGHSLGGWLAAELALRRPDRVARMALVAPLGLHVRGASVPPVFGALAPRGVGGMGEARALFFADAQSAVALGALPDAMDEQAQLRWFGGLAGAARLGWKAPHFQSRRLAERLGRIAVPTLVVRGAADVLVSEEAGRAWVEGLAGAELLEVPDVGHAMALEWPTAADEVGRFLDR